ncbi:MAG: 5-histidylcysteine sulfoxide synthase/putative 4-mercaptohistidine N1-methyltransferase [Cognaticolwellia sp.]|jgi:5-histidylcysteine sulfoxide synthase/putative 4-mercaptohistidine N1-methyltranferase
MINQLNTPTLDGNSIAEKRQELTAYFKNTWSTYDSLFSLINNDDAYFLRPESLRHPLVFYFGHTATFYVNKLILGKYINQRINSRLEAICAVGVDEMSWDDLNSEHYDWPNVDEVRTYREQVYNLVLDLIDTMELSLPIKQDSLAWIILMGCEHERIHLETSSVIMRMLPLKWLTNTEQWQPCLHSTSAPENELIPVKSQTLSLGKKAQDNTFGWDNEYGHQSVDVDDFSAAKFLVSNHEYMSFVEAGGYQSKQFWCQEGLAWLEFTQAKMPRFWSCSAGQYYQRNLTSEMPLPLDWPVEVNYLEAKAFCQWRQESTKGFTRLPTEAQWYCLREHVAGDQHQWQEVPGNINLAYYASSCPVNQHQNGDFFDVIGNTWQWTESAIDGYAGFNVHPLYDDFSTPTFDGKHNLIKGGSWISTGNETLASSRYAFRRHFYQHAGFRYVVSDQPNNSAVTVNKYETSKDICQQLECYFGANALGYENYGQQIAQQVASVIAAENATTKRLLNLGCSVGRVAFELSQHFQHIDAVDFSARTIQYGVQLQTGASVRYTNTIEGNICQYNEITLADKVNNVNGKRILFSQADGCNLKDNFEHYDVILIQHALEQSYDPKRLLANAVSRLNPSGILIILSDYNYNLQTTEKSKWLSGMKVNGENLSGIDALTHQLNADFEPVSIKELTRVVTDSARNFNLSHCQFSVWRAK